jgi:hypothetical protein
MSRRDAWARMTPYEVGIPGRAFAEQNFGAIREEAESRGVDLADPGAFIMLGQVGRVLRELQGEERGSEALQLFADFLFHAFHFHGSGELVLLLETATIRHLVSADEGEGAWAGGSWKGELPTDAGYLQLPRHLVWSHPDPDGPAEDLDGFFWTRSAGGSLSLMAALGIRSDRPGLSVMPLPPVPLADAGQWPGSRARDEGPDFQTTLPGGELDDLYSVVTAGEALKLVSRAFAYMNARPEALAPQERSPHPDEVEDAPRGTRPSFLPFRRIRPPEPPPEST